MSRTVSILLVAGLVSVATACSTAPTPPPLPDVIATAVGWHGEPMPDGLRRGEAEGEYVWRKDGSVMVYVPAGEFTLGRDDGPVDERPARRVHLDAFYIDKYETTWRQWRLSGLGPLKDIDGGPIPETKPVWGRGDDLPVSYIRWHDAVDYAAWVGKRLPTEAEWEKAARGVDGRLYPWGDEHPTFERAVWKEHPIGKDEPAPVDCCPAGASPYGAENMAGNVFEWVRDAYDGKAYRTAAERNPLHEAEDAGTEFGERRVMRGGAFVLDREDMGATIRNRQYPVEGQDYVGFRLVVEP